MLTSHARENTICFTTCDVPTNPMLARIQNASQYGLTKRIPIYISTCVGKIHPIQGRAQNVTRNMLTMPARTEDVSTCVAQTHPMPARTQNLS